MRRFFDQVNLLLILGLVVFADWGWSRLPDQIPVHFGLDGRPDEWADRSRGSWFWAPGVGLALTFGLEWLRKMIPSHPNWVNLPDKTKLGDLPERVRKPVVEMLSGFLALIQTEMLVIFTLIQLSTYRAAMGEESQGLIILVLILAVLSSPLFMMIFFLGLQKAMDRGKRLAAAEESAV